MIQIDLRKRITQLLHRLSPYKYAVLIFLIGAFLMAFPLKHTEEPTANINLEAYEELEADLEALLRCIEGAGRVEVLLTREQSGYRTYQTDTQQQILNSSEETEAKTVLISNSNGADNPILVSTTYPLYRGAVVVCDGADNVTVKYNIVRAVSSATGLSSDKISVIKMSHYQEGSS